MKNDHDALDDLIVLTRVVPELAPLIDGEPPKYRHVANRIANADVPAGLVEYIRGRNYVRPQLRPALQSACFRPSARPAHEAPLRRLTPPTHE
jgi:hypothetical protein